MNNSQLFKLIVNNIHLRNNIYRFLHEKGRNEEEIDLNQKEEEEEEYLKPIKIKKWIKGKDLIENGSLLQMIWYGCDQFFYQLMELHIKEGSKEEGRVARTMFRESIKWGRDNISKYLIKRVGSRMLPPVGQDGDEYLLSTITYQKFLIINDLYKNHFKLDLPLPFLLSTLYKSIQLGDVEFIKLILLLIQIDQFAGAGDGDSNTLIMIDGTESLFKKELNDETSTIEIIELLYKKGLINLNNGIIQSIYKIIDNNNYNQLIKIFELINKSTTDTTANKIIIDSTMITKSCIHFDKKIFDYLINNLKSTKIEFNDNSSYLNACISGNTSILKYLLDDLKPKISNNNFDPHISVNMALNQGNQDCVFHILDRMNGFTISSFEVHPSLLNIEFITRLVSYGPINLEICGGSLLECAVKNEVLEVIDFVLDNSNNPMFIIDYPLDTLLMELALFFGSSKVVEHTIARYPEQQFPLVHTQNVELIDGIYETILKNSHVFMPVSYSHVIYLLKHKKYQLVKSVFEVIGVDPGDIEFIQPLVEMSYSKRAPQDIIEMMIEADSKEIYDEPLVAVKAAGRGDLGFMIRMLELFPSTSPTECIYRASCNDHLEIVKYLLSNYNDQVNSLDQYMQASLSTNSVNVLEYLITSTNAQLFEIGSIYQAITKGNVEAIKILVDHGQHHSFFIPNHQQIIPMLHLVIVNPLLMDRSMQCFHLIYETTNLTDSEIILIIKKDLFPITPIHIHQAFKNCQHQFLILLMTHFYLGKHHKISLVSNDLYRTIKTLAYEYGSLKIINYLKSLNK